MPGPPPDSIDNPKLTTEDGKIILGVQDVSNVEIRAGGITARVLTEQDAVEVRSIFDLY